MHNGIPWWLVVVLHAIHFWPVTLAVILMGCGVGIWWWRRRKMQSGEHK